MIERSEDRVAELSGGIERGKRTCRRERLLLRLGRGRRTLRGRGIDHELEALLGSRQLGDVVFRVRATDMLLHRAISFFLRKTKV